MKDPCSGRVGRCMSRSPLSLKNSMSTPSSSAGCTIFGTTMQLTSPWHAPKWKSVKKNTVISTLAGSMSRNASRRRTILDFLLASGSLAFISLHSLLPGCRAGHQERPAPVPGFYPPTTSQARKRAAGYRVARGRPRGVGCSVTAGWFPARRQDRGDLVAAFRSSPPGSQRCTPRCKGT